MISLNKEQTCLIELIKASLLEIVPVFPENVNWEIVFEIAKAQCIVPLLASSVPSEHINDWLGFAYQNKARFMQMIYEQDSLINLFKANNIPLVVLKGTAAAVYYPNPALRTFGDIDFYVFNEYVNSAIDLLKKNGYQFFSKTEREYEIEKNGMVFELHSKFSCDHYNDIDHIIINGFNNAVEYNIANATFPGLPTFENGLVLLGHIMQHIKTSGIGLRQIIDWMMFVHKELDDAAWCDCFQPLAVEAGLEKLAITVTFMCKKWLGLTNEINWCNTADEELVDQLLIRILDDGNFGNDRSSSESVKNTLKKEGTFKYLQHAGMINWPLAQKYAFFRPFAWLYQLCRYAGKGIAGLFTGKKVFMKNKTNMSLEELWKRLE